MSEQLQGQVSELLRALLAFAGDAKQFASDQIPPLIQEKIAFGRVTETVYLVVFMLLVVGSVMMFVKSVRVLNDDDCPSDGWIGGIIGSVVVGVVCFFVTLLQFNETAMVWFAPRLYIIEWLKGIIK